MTEKKYVVSEGKRKELEKILDHLTQNKGYGKRLLDELWQSKQPVQDIPQTGKTLDRETVDGIMEDCFEAEWEYEETKEITMQEQENALDQICQLQQKTVSEDVESLAREFHLVYQREIARQNKKSKYVDDYDSLSEDIKDLDRALARHVLSKLNKGKVVIAEGKVTDNMSYHFIGSQSVEALFQSYVGKRVKLILEVEDE